MATLTPAETGVEDAMPTEPTRVHHSGGRLGTAYGKITSPAKAERHYRTQKLRFLRMLGHATFRNGSQFAILWVSPTAQTAEVFGSEALQPKLDEWLGPRVRKQALACARQLNQRKAGHNPATAGASIGRSEIFRQDGEVIDPYLDDVDDQLKADEANAPDGDQAGAGTYARGHSAPSRLAADPETSKVAEGLQLSECSSVASLTGDAYQPAADSATPEHALAKKELTSSMPATPVQRTAAENRATPAASGSTTPPPKPAEPSASSTLPASAAAEGVVQTGFVDREFTSTELERWYSSRFDQLEYKVEKLVCRVWIKAIAPGKHKKFPYQDGDASKPDWWPSDLRHKEPDHITKPERLQLLVHLIRRGPGTILALEAATAANSALIPSEKSAILATIYDVARQERKPNPADPGSSPRIFCVSIPADTCGGIGEDVGIRRKKRQVPASATHSTGRSRRKRSRLDDTPPRASEMSELERVSERDSDSIQDNHQASEAAEPACEDGTSSPGLGGDLQPIATSAVSHSPAEEVARSADRREAAETEVSASGRPKRKLVAPTRFAASAHSIGPKRSRRPGSLTVQRASRRTEDGCEGESLLVSSSSDPGLVVNTAYDESRPPAKGDTPFQQVAGLRSPPPTADASRHRPLHRAALQANLEQASDTPRAASETRESRSGLHSPPPTGDSTKVQQSWAPAGRFVRSTSPNSTAVAVNSTSASADVGPLDSSPFRFSTSSSANSVPRGCLVARPQSGLRWAEFPAPSRDLDHPATSFGRDNAYGPPRSCERTSQHPQAQFTPFDGFSHDVHAFTTSDIYTRPPEDRHSTPLRFAHEPVPRTRMQDVRDPYLMTPPGSGGDPYSLGPSRAPMVPNEDDWSAAFARQLDAAMLAVGAVDAADVLDSGDGFHDDELASCETMTNRMSIAGMDPSTVHADLHSSDEHASAQAAFYAPQLSTFSPFRLQHGERNVPPASHSSRSLDAFV